MSICKRYSSDDEEAMEILNNGFLNVFKKIRQHKPVYTFNSFKEWIRQIFLDTIIGMFRKNYESWLGPSKRIHPLITGNEKIFDDISQEIIIEAMRDLSPLYRTVFNLYVIEEMNHYEIAKRMNISVEASKINLSRARAQLQEIISEENFFYTNRMLQSR